MFWHTNHQEPKHSLSRAPVVCFVSINGKATHARPLKSNPDWPLENGGESGSYNRPKRFCISRSIIRIISYMASWMWSGRWLRDGSILLWHYKGKQNDKERIIGRCWKIIRVGILRHYMSNPFEGIRILFTVIFG